MIENIHEIINQIIAWQMYESVVNKLLFTQRKSQQLRARDNWEARSRVIKRMRRKLENFLN